MTTTSAPVGKSAAGLLDPLVRLERLFDRGTLRTLAGRDDSGVLAGRGQIEGIPAVAYASDAARMGGELGRQGCAHIVDTIDLAVRERVPVLGLWHSGGVRLTEGVAALDGVGQVFAAIVRASGRVPQISLVLGPAAGGAAYGAALTDILIMGPGGQVLVTGPEGAPGAAEEPEALARLGGPQPDGSRCPLVHITAEDDQTALTEARKVTKLLGAQGRISPADAAGRDLAAAMEAPACQAYDVKPAVEALLDEPGVELNAEWAPNMVTVLGRFAGRTVGVVANNPLRLGGCIDSAASDKAARFVRMCDSLGVPLIVLVDVPGYLPGPGPEWEGMVLRGAKLLHAFAEAVVPRVTLVTRKAYGGAYIAMNSRSLGATAVYAWPGAEIAVMGAGAAVGVLHRGKLAAVPAEEREALRLKLIGQQTEEAGGLRRALGVGAVDGIIEPARTRRWLAEALAGAPAARGAHGNIPL